MSRKCWENCGKVILSFALHADCITCLSQLFKAVTLGTGTGSVDTAFIMWCCTCHECCKKGFLFSLVNIRGIQKFGNLIVQMLETLCSWYCTCNWFYSSSWCNPGTSIMLWATHDIKNSQQSICYACTLCSYYACVHLYSKQSSICVWMFRYNSCWNRVGIYILMCVVLYSL